MKKVVFICCAFAAMCASFISCDEFANPDTGYEGKNYLYATPSATEMFDQENSSITVEVELTAALEADLTLTFTTTDTEDKITLEGNPVVIKAGEKKGSFTIKSKALNGNSATYTVSMSEETVLPENVEWETEFNLTFKVNSVTEPDNGGNEGDEGDNGDEGDTMDPIVKAYYEVTGIDLSKYLGLVNVTTEYTAASIDSEIPLEPVTITGQTFIKLSESATESTPVLEMTVNPMGLKDVLYNKFLDLTVRNTSMWFDEEYSPEDYQVLCDAIKWSATSEETFEMTLDNIVLNGTKVEFIADHSYYDEYWEEDITLFRVPFEFTYTAYDRELEAIEAGLVGEAYNEYWSEDATANPAFHLNCADISSDLFACGNYVEASAVISNEKLEFIFCMYHSYDYDYDYSKVIATYTPNK